MDLSPVGMVCSFCGAVGTQETRFAGGLGAAMCADCLSYHHERFQSSENLVAISKPPWEKMSDAEVLGTLPRISAVTEQVDRFLDDWVQMCRARNLSWAEIGKAMGVSRQAAWERFSEVRASRRRGTA